MILFSLLSWGIGVGGSMHGGLNLADFVAHPRVWTAMAVLDFPSGKNFWNFKLGYVRFNTYSLPYENPVWPYGQGLILEALYKRELVGGIGPVGGLVLYGLRNDGSGGNLQFPAGVSFGLSVGTSDYGFEAFLIYRWELMRLRGYFYPIGVSQPLFDTDDDALAFFNLYHLTLGANLYLYNRKGN